MNIKSLIASALLLSFIIHSLIAGCQGTAAEQTVEPAKSVFRYCNPIRSEAIGPFRDPQIINVGDTYYLTGTTSPFWPGTVCPGIKLWSSKDLLNWKFETFLIERSKLPKDVWYRDRFWAPEIHHKNGKFWLTFNCRNESKKYPHVHSCGRAVADKITGPYTVLTHDKPLLDGWGNDMTLLRTTTARPMPTGRVTLSSRSTSIMLNSSANAGGRSEQTRKAGKKAI